LKQTNIIEIKPENQMMQSTHESIVISVKKRNI